MLPISFYVFENCPPHPQKEVYEIQVIIAELIPERQKSASSCGSKGKKRRQNPTVVLKILTRGDSKRYFSRKKKKALEAKARES